MASSGRIQRVGIWGVLALLIFGLHWFGLFDGLYDWTRTALSPFTRTVFQAGQSKNPSSLSEEDMQSLEDQVQNLLVENARLRTKVDDLKEIDVQLEFLEKAQLEGTQGKIIGNTTDNFSKLFIVNRGKGDGIRKGQGVIAGEGFLVGVVDSVEEHTSLIRPLNDSHIAIAAKAQNSTSSPGIIKGRHGLSVRMELIPQTEEIQVGERVVTSELMDNIPPNILIGTIDSIQFQEGELFQNATISPLFDEETLRVVTIL